MVEVQGSESVLKNKFDEVVSKEGEMVKIVDKLRQENVILCESLFQLDKEYVEEIKVLRLENEKVKIVLQKLEKEFQNYKVSIDE